MNAEKKHGCHNRKPFAQNVIVLDGRFYESHSGHICAQAIAKEIPFRMERSCQYTLSELGRTDPQCHGCSWRKEDDAE